MTSVAALVGRSASEGIDPRRNLPHDSRLDLPHGSLTGDGLRRNLPYGVRQAAPDDARVIHELITRHREEGRLLPRHLGEIAVHTSRFIVAIEEPSEEGEIVGCADLAPLSRTVAEVRSLVVSKDARSAGVGRRLIDAVIARAGAAGFERVCAFTHAPSYFVQLGFSIVPHDWLPEKISTDCGTCTQFRTCGQYAVMLPLKRASAFAKASTSAQAPVATPADRLVSRASLHG